MSENSIEQQFYNSYLGVPFEVPQINRNVATFALVKRRVDTNKAWYEDAGDVWICNRFGSKYRKDTDDEVLEVVQSDDYLNLDYRKTDLLRESSDAGWLSPEGRFYGCDYANHDAVAELILRKRVGRLEIAGWIRVAGEGANLYCLRSPTEQQRAWASRHGHVFSY